MQKNCSYTRPFKPQNAIDRYIGYKSTRKKTIYHLTQNIVYTCEVTFQEGIDFAKANY
jgi:LacI family transcriptional regulator